MLDKGKGLIVGKLRTIQLIEANLQLIIRILLGNRNNGAIKVDERISKYNYRSSRNYNIEEAILEKRLIYDCSVFNHKPIVHVIIDLEAYYNRQLSNICGIVKESLGISRQGIKLIAKVMPVLNHYVCTGFGISKNSYGSIEQQILGTGQGNRFSGDASRDTPYYINREVET